VVVLLMTPAAAAPHGPGCQLSTSECAVVAREIATEQVLQEEDARSFGYGMTPYARAQALITRHYDRLDARVPFLPTRIANEIGRIVACRAADNLAQMDGRQNPDPRCR
jgi:hypothetical protein